MWPSKAKQSKVLCEVNQRNPEAPPPHNPEKKTSYIHIAALDRSGMEWIGLDWTGMDWIGLDWDLKGKDRIGTLCAVRVPVCVSWVLRLRA